MHRSCNYRYKSKVVFIVSIICILWIVQNRLVNTFSDSSSERSTQFDYDHYIQAPGFTKSKHSFEHHGFNQTVSDTLALNRPVPDTRHVLCRKVLWNSLPIRYPDVSVIVIFHNEARSTLLRTIVSVLNRTPDNILLEILLIDDFSDNPDDGFALAMMEKVRVLRNSVREGLIRSRIRGAAAANGEVLVFLDSHCEVNVDWVQPLLLRITQTRSSVVSPVIDIIDANDFSYKAGVMNSRGVFDWNLVFKWERLPKEEISNRQRNPIQPIR